MKQILTSLQHDGSDHLGLWFKVPAMTINFAFLPMWGRIPWVATVSLAWTMVLSAMRGSSEVPMVSPQPFSAPLHQETRTPPFRVG